MTILSTIFFKEPRSIEVVYGKLNILPYKINAFNNIKTVVLFTEYGNYLGLYSLNIAYIHNVVKIEYCKFNEVRVYVKV